MFGFRLTPEYRDQGFTGGSINCTPLGHAFDVGKALENGDGVILTEDSTLSAVLDGYPALERVPENEIPVGAQPAILPGKELLESPPDHPWVPQSGGIPQEWLQEHGAGEVAAQHVDEPGTTGEALMAGEAVSGDKGSSEGGDKGSSEQSPKDSGEQQGQKAAATDQPGSSTTTARSR